MAFPDRLDAPARTVITSEGGAGASRTTHVVRQRMGGFGAWCPRSWKCSTGLPGASRTLPASRPQSEGF